MTAFDDVLRRRSLLIPVSAGPVGFRLRTVPDRATIDPASIAGYLALFAAREGMALETAAAIILEDASDQIIPFWIEVRLRRSDQGPGIGIGHEVKLEDRRHGWKGLDILGRLEP